MDALPEFQVFLWPNLEIKTLVKSIHQWFFIVELMVGANASCFFKHDQFPEPIAGISKAIIASLLVGSGTKLGMVTQAGMASLNLQTFAFVILMALSMILTLKPLLEKN